MTSSGATGTMRLQRVEPLPLAGAEQQALREVWGQTLVELAADYPELVVLDGDLANSTRADIFATTVPDRFFEMGIAEQNMVGVAAGMATLGFVPWLSTFAAFMANRATDQVSSPERPAKPTRAWRTSPSSAPCPAW
jgi:deoxyxylulose-5-phosphate synthase